MQNAAAAVADEVRRLRARRVFVACGPGNNGGDGLAMAALLAGDMEVRVLLAEKPAQIRQPEARWALEQVDTRRVSIEVYRDAARVRELARDSDWIVDALLGIGVGGELREPVRSIVRAIRQSGKPVLSIDIPTGLGTKTALRPRITVCLHAKKPGLNPQNAGRILVREIGIPREAVEQVGPADFFMPYRRNESRSHKGKNGRLLIVAGGPYTGAPMLCAGSALRTGIDLVRLLAPKAAADAAQIRYPDLIVHPGNERRRLVPDDSSLAASILPSVDAVLLGPGVGDHPESVDAMNRILDAAARRKVPVVLDADAIVVAGGAPKLVRRLRPLVTPHHGEFKEFTGTRVPEGAKALEHVRRQAKRLSSTLLVKGPVDLISDGVRAKTNNVHHPAMTTGGTGDVLAGLCAGFLSKGMEPFRAACAAAFVNGDAGRSIAERQGGSLLATDLIRELPQVFQRWLGGRAAG